jgi:hypothetical protein
MRRTHVVVLLTALVVVIGALVAYAAPLANHNAAEAACVAAVPLPDGSPGGNGSVVLEWKPLPLPHWDCRYRSESGESATINLGWWGN